MTYDQATRENEIHTARVYLREARQRGKQPFAFTLLQWAANCRRRAMAIIPPCAAQGDLFAPSRHD